MSGAGGGPARGRLQGCSACALSFRRRPTISGVREQDGPNSGARPEMLPAWHGRVRLGQTVRRLVVVYSFGGAIKAHGDAMLITCTRELTA